MPCLPAGREWEHRQHVTGFLGMVRAMLRESPDVDVQGFVELAGGRDVPVYPCLDDHHGTDAYLNPGPELFRGVFVNWLSQGAAGAQTFNWAHASAATHARLGVRSLPAVRRQMFANFLLRRLPIGIFSPRLL